MTEEEVMPLFFEWIQQLFGRQADLTNGRDALLLIAFRAGMEAREKLTPKTEVQR